jgi:epoxyqueuosine reductase
MRVSTGEGLKIKSWAAELGFEAVGFASLEPLEEGRHYLRWLDRGEHAGMEYMRRRLEMRLDPSLIFPGARSAICVGLRYFPLAGEQPVEGDLWPRVARYAHGVDYHDLMLDLLGQLEDRVTSAWVGTRTRAYVDTGPVLERPLAARAGLGGIGKNTLLLHPEFGSWLLLGELFVDLELQPDEPSGDLCGSCSLCLDACPTGALVEPYRLDSRRCISYWTIEHRGELPTGTGKDLHGWVFGCDICQEVCPFNDPASAVERAPFSLPEGRRRLGLRDLLCLGREDYVETFRRSPMKRPKLGGLKRNAAAAMGASGDQAYVEALTMALDEEEEMVREEALRALTEIFGGAADEALETNSEEGGDDAPERSCTGRKSPDDAGLERG